VTAYGVTSLTAEEATPARLLALVRGHWHMENKLHYIRDFSYDEDRSQVRTGNGPRAMSSLRNLAIVLIRWQGWAGIPTGNRYYTAHPTAVLSLLGA